GKYILDRHPGGLLDLAIGVNAGQAETMRKTAADRGLARSHHTHENDRSPPERLGDERLRRGKGQRGRGDHHGACLSSSPKSRWWWFLLQHNSLQSSPAACPGPVRKAGGRSCCDIRETSVLVFPFFGWMVAECQAFFVSSP